MTKEDIISGSKLIAEYMNLVYLPFSAESERQALLKEKGMKAGWYQTVTAEPQVEKVKVDGGREIIADINIFKYNIKNGWKFFEGYYYKYVCRTHGDLRYWNSLDELVPVIQKIEKEFKDVKFHLNNNGCEVKIGKCWEYSSFTLPNWNQNVFSVVVSFLREKLGK